MDSKPGKSGKKDFKWFKLDLMKVVVKGKKFATSKRRKKRSQRSNSVRQIVPC